MYLQSVPERLALGVTNISVDLLSGQNEVEREHSQLDER